MLDRLPVSSKMGIYLQNTTGVHYDVVLDVSEGISNLNTRENQKINFSSKKEVGQNMITLSARLFAKGLKPLDVGSDGNCFFRAVSHQLFQNSNFHQIVRSTAIDYIRSHPEQFIESIANNSFSEYINTMSVNGTWAGAIAVQATSDALNCVIDITESALNFNATTIIHPAIQRAKYTKIHIGHNDELHYVSTTTCSENNSKTSEDTTNTSKVKLEQAQKLESPEKQISSMSSKTDSMKRKICSFIDPGKGQHELECKKSKYDPEKIKYSDISETQKCIRSFHDLVKSGPEYICTCCDQLWYRTSVKVCKPSSYNMCPGNILKLCCTNVKSVDNIEWICYTCHSNLEDGKLPACSKANGMKFPQKCDLLNLTPLEERLISPRIPFMQIHELPRGGQFKIHGNVVNVPANVNSTVNVLPRSMNELQTIPVKLKRRLGYKHHYAFQTIRPLKVLKTSQYLGKNSKLFINEGIQVNDSFLDTYTNEIGNNLLYEPKCMNEQGDQSNTNPIIEGEKNKLNNINKQHELENKDKDLINCKTSEDSSDDNWCEIEERPAPVMDTLLAEPDTAQDSDLVFNFAPGEGNKPLGLFTDKDSEYLSFPTIFCGERRVDNKDRLVPVHYSTVCKWEMRSRDRRVAQSVPNIFYKLKKLQIKRIQDTASIALRKCKTKGKKYKAGDLKSEACIQKLVHLDEGFRVFRNLRGSPPYFEKCKKDLFAMI